MLTQSELMVKTEQHTQKVLVTQQNMRLDK